MSKFYLPAGWIMRKDYQSETMSLTWKPDDGRMLTKEDLEKVMTYPLQFSIHVSKEEDQLTLMKAIGRASEDQTCENSWEKSLKQHLPAKYRDVDVSMADVNAEDELKFHFKDRELDSFDREDFEIAVRDAFIEIGLKLFKHQVAWEGILMKDLQRRAKEMGLQMSPKELLKQVLGLQYYKEKRDEEALKYFSLPNLNVKYKSGSVIACATVPTVKGAPLAGVKWALGSKSVAVWLMIPPWAWLLIGATALVAVSVITYLAKRVSKVDVYRDYNGSYSLSATFENQDVCTLL